MQEPGAKAPVIVAGKDVAEVDTDYLLLPVSIRDHEGPLGASFPVENRLLPQGAPPPRRTACGHCPPAHRALGDGCAATRPGSRWVQGTGGAR
jgi:hypothetical protein